MCTKFLNILPALVCAGAITVLSFISPSRLPVVSLVGIDKLVHALVYGMLYLLTANGLEKNNCRRMNSIFCAAALALSYGMVIEWMQGTMTSDREMDVYDAMANAVGIVISIGMGALMRPIRKSA